ncbi:MAG: hypothetical protein M1833_003338 [Piccolia ochrophora]|nr:MAG: hypothetical protein M1833_003338 [Piccolia ochrophora]
MPMTWDDDANKRLVATLLAVHEFKVDYAAMASMMEQRWGYEVTAKAITHRITALKAFGKQSANGSTPATPKTPKTPKAKAANGTPKTKTASTGKGKKRTAAEANEDDDGFNPGNGYANGDGFVKEESPSKKPKIVKEEIELESEEDGDENGGVAVS